MNNGGVLRLRKLFEPASRNFAYPVTLRSQILDSRFLLRPFTEDDEGAWNSVRSRNREWLAPWGSSDPQNTVPLSYQEWVRSTRESAQEGEALVLGMVEAGRIVGEISLGAICYGSLRSGIVGYWVDQAYAGRGLAPLAVALLADWALFSQDGPHLHRLEIALLPVNGNSRRVAEKVGFAYEGIKHRYMHVAGQWQDHESWILLSEDVEGSVESRLAERLRDPNAEIPRANPATHHEQRGQRE